MTTMTIGRQTLLSNPTVQIPPCDDPTDHTHSSISVSGNSFFSGELEVASYDDLGECDDVLPDAFSCDHFRMYGFKIKRCARGRSHDWTECPYAHPGEKARRRDPRKFHYSGNPCPEFRNGTCFKGDACELAHGVFECWLHPSRYRTQPCKDGVQCHRRICFFAHTPDQLRVLPLSPKGLSQPESYDGSPSRRGTNSFVGKASFVTSPTSTLYHPPCSPPMSPVSSIGPNSVTVNELASSVRNLQIGYPARFSLSRNLFTLRPGYTGLPSTPTQNLNAASVVALDVWDEGCRDEEEPVMQRVESGKELRAKIYAKLGRDNSFGGAI